MRLLLAAVVSFLTLTGCAPAGVRAAGAGTAGAGAQAKIVDLLQASAQSWNQGDLDGFLLPYAEGEGTTFVGSRGLLRGMEAIRSTYQQSYFSGGAPASLLDFRDIEVRPLGPDNALAVGRYLLRSRDTGAQVAEGIFSLVLTRTPEGWRIVHDHSS